MRFGKIPRKPLPQGGVALRARVLLWTLCLVLIASAAGASSTQAPTRAVFSRGADRLADAVSRGRWLNISLSASPRRMPLVPENARLLAGMLSAEASVCAMEDGGQIILSLLGGGETLLTLRQAAGENWAALNADGSWLMTAPGAEEAAAASLGLGELGKWLLSFDYARLKEGVIPYFTAFYDGGVELWRLASPYAEDNNRLSTGSGATSHALTYVIDTEGLRAIALQLAQAHQSASLPLPGVSRAAQDAFWQKVRGFAAEAELTRDVKANLTFGENDILRTAKLSGTVRMSGKTAGISYNYSCGVTSTRITRKYSLRYEPSVGDTISLNCTWLTSCSGKGGAAHKIALSASGKYDGKRYSVKWDSDLVNKYSLDAQSALTEKITGEIDATVKYDGETLVALDFTVDGGTFSTSDKQAVQLSGSADGKVSARGETVFEGALTLNCSAGDTGEAPLLSLNGMTPVAEMDAQALTRARDSLQSVWRDAVARFAAGLPDEIKYQITISE